MLAGFAVPTQRALIMLTVVMLAIVFKRQLRPLSGLSLAMIAVLLFDPLSALSVGFWFSFLAVAVIAYCFTGRMKQGPVWAQWWKLQTVLALGLLPLSLFVFYQGSLIAPLANFILVPWVSFLVVPLILLASVISAVYQPLACLLFDLANHLLAIIWPLIEGLSGLSIATVSHTPGLLMLVLLMLGLMLLLAPAGMPARWMGLVLLIPVFFQSESEIKQGEFKVNLLDVGQGLAIFIQTRSHHLLFDTGPRFSDSFDTGEKVILPYFKALGIKSLDKLVVSHADNDHMGGAQAIIDNLIVREVVGQGVDKLVHPHKTACLQGQSWQYDAVKFEFIHPDAPDKYRHRNNTACVLKIESAHGHLLIASDIEARVEQHLVAAQSDKLASDVLLVPHHGSKTSSTHSFIKAVSPQLALVSSGFRNRFGHPKKEVVERYQLENIVILNTAQLGAIKLQFGTEQNGLEAESWRQQAGRYWNHW